VASAAKAAGVTQGEVRLKAVERLRVAGVETPEIDARALLCFALETDEASLVSDSKTPISDRQKSLFDGLIARRISGEPVARIVGCKEFWSRSFRLGAEILVPRPETETLVEAALSIFPDRDAALRVLDLGTGSGILLAAILLERKNASGVGVDRSEQALRVARENLDALDIKERAQFVCGNWAAALQERFDLIIANPPYIESGTISSLAREVREYDPLLALNGGADGLDAYRSIIAELPHLLSARGVTILELGAGQEAAVRELAQASDLRAEGPARPDLGGVPRALILYPRTQK
jgi:release factor glutamine methyltransferase